MNNFKQTLAALIAVLLIGSLAVAQAADISSANAKKIEKNNYLTVTDVTDLTEIDTKDAVVIEEEEQTEVSNSQETKSQELVDFRGNVIEYEDTAVERAKPFIPVTGYIITTTGKLNVRSAESFDSEILDSLQYGQAIDIIDETDEWYVIPYGDGIGYVYKQYVTTSYEEAKEILLATVMYECGVVAVPSGEALNVRSAPGTEGTLIIDQVTNGDCIIVLSRDENGWMKVCYGNDYSVGYVLAQYASIGGMVAKDTVAQKRINRINEISEAGVFVADATCYYMPSKETMVVNSFKRGNNCLVVAEGSEWTKVAFGANRTCGYVKSDTIMTMSDYNAMKAKKAESNKSSKTDKTNSENTTKKTTKKKVGSASASAPKSNSKGQSIVNAAANYLGVRYVYGGTSPKGFDCSGLVQYACKQCGISVNRTSRAQYSNGVAVSKSNLQAGDLVFFSKGSGISHVGIYAGNGQVIHAPSPGKKVSYIALSKMCSYSTYVGARRVY